MVLLGQGDATGMFFHAPAGTELPTYPTEELSEEWNEVGLVGEEGISLTNDKSTSNIKDWANRIARVLLTDHSEKIKVTIIDTTLESLKVVLGDGNVTEVAADSDHGTLMRASISTSALPTPEAFLFLMKDGDTTVMIGCERGQIDSMDDVTFAPGDAVKWAPTITGLEDGWVMVIDDGEEIVTT